MVSLFSLAWNIIKAARYLAPFLHEASKEYDPSDPIDVHATENLRRVFRTIIWRLIVYITFFIIVFFYVVPMTSANQLLEKELAEEQAERQSIEIRFNKYQEDKTTQIDTLKEQIAELRVHANETSTLKERFALCREDVAELRVLLGDKGKAYITSEEERNRKGQVIASDKSKSKTKDKQKPTIKPTEGNIQNLTDKQRQAIDTLD